LSFSETCATCVGEGSILADDAPSEYNVSIPVGVREGAVLVATSEENQSTVLLRVRYNSTTGDDYVAVDKESGDVEVVKTIGVAEALCGGFQLTGVVDTAGRVRDAIDIPLGKYTPPDSHIRVAGGGLPPHGDLVIRVAVKWPLPIKPTSSMSDDDDESRRFRKRIRTHATILHHILHVGTKKIYNS